MSDAPKCPNDQVRWAVIAKMEKERGPKARVGRLVSLSQCPLRISPATGWLPDGPVVAPPLAARERAAHLPLEVKERVPASRAAPVGNP
jgi:hypothetical protein